MTANTATGRQNGAGEWIAVLAAADGSGVQPHARRLADLSQAALRDLADTVHALCAVHGPQPGMVDAALTRHVQPEAEEWLHATADALGAERAFLAQLTAAAGPLPSTPGQAASETALVTMRAALLMLARSDRVGCATGAVAALTIDWPAIRAVLDRAAGRFGVDAPPCRVPAAHDTAALLATLAQVPAVERAIGFGAQQCLAQHRGLWALLESRAAARDRS